MSLHTLLLTGAVIGIGIAQYGLVWVTLRDLNQRSRVRGNNKVLWGLCILCLPLLGAIFYSWSGPMGFRRRQPIDSSLGAVLPHLPTSTRDDPSARQNITPIKPVGRTNRLSHVVGSTAVTLVRRDGTRSIIPTTTRYRKTGS